MRRRSRRRWVPGPSPRASIVHFSVQDAGLSLHVWLVIIILSITAPVTTMVLARAALFRRRQAGDPLPPPLHGSEG